MPDHRPAQHRAVQAGETSVLGIDDGKHVVRGYAFEELALQTDFEEVAHLLIYGDLPGRRQLSLFKDMLSQFRRIPTEVLGNLRSIPTDVTLPQALRTVVSYAGHYDPVEGDSVNDLRRRSAWLCSLVAMIARGRTLFVQRRSVDEPVVGSTSADLFLGLLAEDRRTEDVRQFLNRLLVAVATGPADGGALAARVTAACGAAMTAGLVAALSARPVRIERCVQVLADWKGSKPVPPPSTELSRLGFTPNVGQSESAVAAVIFGLIEEWGPKLDCDALLERFQRTVETARTERLQPGLATAIALALAAMGCPPPLAGGIVASARVPAWCAHWTEQRHEGGLEPAELVYRGPALKSIPPLAMR